MADFEEYDDDQEVERQPLDPNIRKQLREAEKARKELDGLRAELETQKREVQFSKAGIPDSGIGSLFRKAYDGETSQEAIRAAAQEYGILKDPNEVIETPSNDAELAALRRAQGATVGTSGVQPDAGQLYLERLAEAATPEEVMRIVEGNSGKELGVYSSRGAF
jgi:hypothetical protein